MVVYISVIMWNVENTNVNKFMCIVWKGKWR